MPWNSFFENGEYCVYQIDDNDEKTGSSLGCHETEEEANDQIAALNASEDEEARGLFENFWNRLKQLVSPKRAISGQQVFDALWQRMFDLDLQIEGSDHFLVDVYFDENGFYALYVDRGKLYRYDLEVQDNNIVLGERIEVMEVHQPVESRTVIRQQPDGKFRWFSVSGTAVLNRSGEIDSRDLFDSFIEYAERTGQYPIRMFYHQGGISEDWEMDESTLAYKTGQADFLARDGYCYITSGLYDDTSLAKIEIEALQNNPDFWGESIRFWPTRGELTEISEGIKIPVYTEGFNVEISTLPETDAAHLMTRTEVHMSLNGKARDAWLKLWTDAGMTEEDALKWLADNPQARNRAIDDAGMITRDGEGEDVQDDNTQQAEDVTEDESIPPDIEIDDSVIEAVGETVTQSEAFTQLSDRLTQVETQLTERSKADGDLTQAIERLNQRLDKLEGVESARQQQADDDKPAKFKQTQRVVYRPRFASVDPNENGTPYAERAAGNMPKGAY